MRLLVSRLRFASLNSATPRRRTGQALLLAVLIMIFVALVGATFITVVSLNMDATATQEERQKAASAANAGMEVINYQINANGTDWRPEKIAPPPAPIDPEYSYYWTAQDIARGYARSVGHVGGWNATSPNYDAEWQSLELAKAGGARVFVKFPDPRLEQNTGSHTYMAEVAVATTLLDGADKAGMLRITVVGQSSDDPNVFVKRVAYKGTSEKNGAFAWGLFHTNWSYQKDTTVATEWTPGADVPIGTANSIPVKDASSIAPGRTLVLQQGGTSEFVIVSAVNYNTNTITLKAPFNTRAYVAGAVSVRAATNVMNDIVGFEGAAQTPAITTQFNADGESTSRAFENIVPQTRRANAGFYFNTDVLLQSKTYLVLGNNQEMKVAGLIGRLKNPTSDPAASPTAVPPGEPNKTIAQVTATNVASALNMPVSLPHTNYPSAPIVGSTGLSAEQKRVYDNPNVTGAESTLTDPTRSEQPQTPPNLEKFTRLLEETKYQPGGVSGLGPNLYINNIEDREKVLDGTLPYRELTVAELHRLWQGKSFTSINNTGNAAIPAGGVGAGNGVLAPGVPNTGNGFKLAFRHLAPPLDSYTYPMTAGSLEQRGIRGWISNYEFLPRGVLVELQGNTIVVTLDSASDADPTLPNTNKAWPWAATAPTPMKNAYRMEIDTLTNTRRVRLAGATTQAVYTPAAGETFGGIIYAEGNVRVRGISGTKPITIVSMNNIYIEGKLKQGTGRISLLARKNVTLNPTQFITRADGTHDTSVGARAANAGLQVLSGTGTTGDPLIVQATLPAVTPDTGAAASFRVGDWIRIGTGRPVPWRQIEHVLPSNALVLAPLATAPTPAANDPVTLLFDPPVVNGNDLNIYPPNAPHVTTTPVSPADGARRIGDNFQVTEQFYRLGHTTPGQPTSGVFLRDIKSDGLVPTTGSGGAYLLGLRTVGERKEAIALQFIGRSSVPNPLPPPDYFPTSLPQVYSISSREENSATINNIWDSTEDLFKGTHPSDTEFPFSIDLHNVTGSSTTDVDNRISALKTQFNANFVDKWQLQSPTNGAYGSAPTIQYAAFMLANGASGDNAIAARYIARYGPTNGIGDDWKTDRFPLTMFSANYPFTGDEVIKLPLTVSVGLNWQTNLQTIFGAGTSIIGTNPSETASQNAGELETSQTDFYWFNNNNSGTTAATRWMDKQQWLRYLSRTLSAPGTGSNLIALQRDPDTSTVLPALRVGALKLEVDDFAAPPVSTTRDYTPVEIPIEATIFAQEGSWFVIPMPQQHRTDRDSNGNNTNPEIAAATRFNRLNYKIKVIGAIVQNYAPTALEDYDDEHSPDNLSVGAMHRWMDAYAYPTKIGRDGATLGTGPNPLGYEWATIEYDNSVVIPVNSGLYLPPSPDLSYGS
ncbi:MAG TPA: hypothetical protein VGB77_01415 [Abditibacteriaceae bacterium]|jgi:hypothetical protein